MGDQLVVTGNVSYACHPQCYDGAASLAASVGFVGSTLSLLLETFAARKNGGLSVITLGASVEHICGPVAQALAHAGFEYVELHATHPAGSECSRQRLVAQLLRATATANCAGQLPAWLKQELSVLAATLARDAELKLARETAEKRERKCMAAEERDQREHVAAEQLKRKRMAGEEELEMRKRAA